MNELALFAGTGGGILGGHLLGWRCVCAVEKDSYPQKIIRQRQSDGLLPPFPIYPDVRSFDGHPWRGRVDIISGGFPCQDISEAGKKPRTGIEGAQSGLIREMLRIINEVSPAFVIAENSPKLRTRGLVFIIGELASMGYDAKWGIIGAASAGGNHVRERMWIVAHRAGERLPIPPKVLPLERQGFGQSNQPAPNPLRPAWWRAEPGMARVAYGPANRMDRTRAIGNGQVPCVVALAWHYLGP